jgi:hypothetical protein
MKIEIEFQSTNPVDNNAKKIAIQKLAHLNVDVITKLAELSNNKKVVDTFMNPPAILRPFFKG